MAKGPAKRSGGILGKTRKDHKQKQALQQKVRSKQRKEITRLLDENPDMVWLTLEYLREGIMQADDLQEEDGPEWHGTTSKIGDLPKYFMADVINTSREFLDEVLLTALDRANKNFVQQAFAFMAGVSMKWPLPKALLNKAICSKVFVARCRKFGRFPNKASIKATVQNKMDWKTVGVWTATEDDKAWTHDKTGVKVEVDVGKASDYEVKFNFCDTEAKIARGSNETPIAKMVKAQNLSDGLKAYSLAAFVEDATKIADAELKAQRAQASAKEVAREQKQKKADMEVVAAAATNSGGAASGSSRPAWTRKWKKSPAKPKPEENSDDDGVATVSPPKAIRVPNF